MGTTDGVSGGSDTSSTGAGSADAARDSTRSAEAAGRAASLSSSDPGTSRGVGSSDAARDSTRSGEPDSSVSRTTAESFAASPTTADAYAASDTTSDGLAAAPTTAQTLADGIDAVDDPVTLAGNAAVGFSVPMNGMTLGDRSIVDPQFGFGRFEPGSRSPTRGAPIGAFSDPLLGRPDFSFGPHMARQSMVSSQTAFEYARSVDPRLRNTVFEAASPAADVNRTYDARIGAPDAAPNYVEVKAGKTISGTQLARDVELARTGTNVDYVFGRNPITGNHGPDAANQARLARATADTNGRLGTTVADIDVAPQIDQVTRASRFSRAARGAGRVLGPVTMAMDGYNIYSGVRADGGFGPQAKAAVGEAAGGWAGAASGGFVGAKSGAVIGAVVGGPAGAAVGAVVGGAVGAIGGAIGGSALGRTIGGWFS